MSESAQKATVLDFPASDGSQARITISGGHVHVEGVAWVTVDMPMGPTGEKGIQPFPAPEEEGGIISVDIKPFGHDGLNVAAGTGSARRGLSADAPRLEIRRAADSPQGCRRVRVFGSHGLPEGHVLATDVEWTTRKP